ncbi:hypothetical protein M409DRAFT_52162 [Zasmidium cellare ATCC 36951]|uniref:Uncharacterized protein n=1 Tax=Zasmidium cellare ATCC 36951 TaxID=1080233 RepID=A0A6A6CUZ7_ZASCE|nr:uncharacterized protein M409DRAFT_52162 [Zasmidium cellare ATCC 36951]KAF2169642.1 hypothetical protein M409DRAFT_52162 [Zasmidium cellare ATCC 36951]
MSDSQPYRRPSTIYPPPHVASQQFPEVGIEDWSCALAQLVELARMRIADHGGLLSDLYQLQQQGNPFLSAAASANMFPPSLGGLPRVERRFRQQLSAFQDSHHQVRR